MNLHKDLYSYQLKGVEFLQKRGGTAGLFMEMLVGTGKTRTSLTYLNETGAERILVVCPVSVAGVWRDEVHKLQLPWKGIDLTRGTLATRAAALKRYHPRIALLNYEVFWSPNSDALKSENKSARTRASSQRVLINAIKSWGPDAVVLDEAHRIKSRSARQSRFAASLSRLQSVKYRLALTGTPIVSGLEDLFAIYRFIDPEVFGTRWAGFSARYISWGGYMGYKIVGYMNEAEARRKVAETAYIVSKSEALDLPEQQDVTVPVTLIPASRRQYNLFRKEAIAEIEGVSEAGEAVRGTALARIVLTSLIRLQQLTGGFVRTEDEGTIDVSSEKLDAALEIIADATAQHQQVVVFCRFKRDIRRLYEQLLAAHHSAAVISGEVGGDERDLRLSAFRRGLSQVLLVQIATGSLGIDLSCASVAIFYSFGYSLGEHAQARDRLHRIGQRNPVTYYYLLARDTVDEAIYAALKSKQDVAGKISNLDYARKLLA